MWPVLSVFAKSCFGRLNFLPQWGKGTKNNKKRRKTIFFLKKFGGFRKTTYFCIRNSETNSTCFSSSVG